MDTGSYKCSKCNEFTVDYEYSLDRPAWGYDEVGWHDYSCSKCGSECSIRASEDTTRIGDTIDF